jgi:hypothetical protein
MLSSRVVAANIKNHCDFFILEFEYQFYFNGEEIRLHQQRQLQVEEPAQTGQRREECVPQWEGLS